MLLGVATGLVTVTELAKAGMVAVPTGLFVTLSKAPTFIGPCTLNAVALVAAASATTPMPLMLLP